MSAFEGVQIKPTYLPIDIRLTVNAQHVLFPHKINRDVNNIRQNLSRSLITLYDNLNIVDISINLQLVRTVMKDNVSMFNYFYIFVILYLIIPKKEMNKISFI